MPHYRVRYAAHDDEARAYVRGNLHDLLGSVPFGYPLSFDLRH